MIDIVIPGSVAYVVHPCSESPWGTEGLFNEEIADWLDERVGGRGWDHDIIEGSPDCLVSIEDSKIALLFKLTWGGHGLADCN